MKNYIYIYGDCFFLSEDCHPFFDHWTTICTQVTFQSRFWHAWIFTEITLELFILPNCLLRNKFVYYRVPGNMSMRTAWFCLYHWDLRRLIKFTFQLQIDVNRYCTFILLSESVLKSYMHNTFSFKITTSIPNDDCTTFSQCFPMVRISLLCLNVCVFVCVCIYIYIKTHTHTHTSIHT